MLCWFIASRVAFHQHETKCIPFDFDTREHHRDKHLLLETSFSSLFGFHKFQRLEPEIELLSLQVKDYRVRWQVISRQKYKIKESKEYVFSCGQNACQFGILFPIYTSLLLKESHLAFHFIIFRKEELWKSVRSNSDRVSSRFAILFDNKLCLTSVCDLWILSFDLQEVCSLSRLIFDSLLSCQHVFLYFHYPFTSR